MLATRNRFHEDLPTIPLPTIAPPQPAPPPLRLAARSPMVVPRLLAKATIVIHLPIGALDERELLQAVEWLHGRNAMVLIERTDVVKRAFGGVARAFGAARRALASAFAAVRFRASAIVRAMTTDGSR